MSDEKDEEVRDVSAELVSDSLGVLERAQIDTQISTAKKYPRSVKIFKAKALEMATLDEDTAESMFYALPRAGKTIEGPSVRLAEIVGSAWGNIRYGSRVIEVGDKFITAQGVCFDLETNTQAAVEVRRRITDKNGRRYNEDMIGTTGNAAMSIALRNAIFKVVPFAYVKSVYDAAKLVAIGKDQPMSTRRTRAFDFFKKLGATEAQVLAIVGRPGIEDVTIDDLVTLTGLKTAIRDGDTSIDMVLGDVNKTATTVTPATLTPESMAGAAVTGTNDAKRPEEEKPAAVAAPAAAPAPAPAKAKAPKPEAAKPAAAPAPTSEDDEAAEAARLFED